jgi:type I restriction enzyme S subunit
MQLTRLGDVAHINPRFDKSSLADDVPVSFVQMASVGASDGKINVSIVRPFAEVKKGSYTPFKDGDVLFAKVTPCMENGKMAIARGLMSGVGFGSSEFHVLRPSDQVDANYLYYFVSSQAFRKEAAGHMTGAVGLRRVPAAFLADAQLPMVPLDEQRRIVAEIETQFSRLDEAVANLHRVKANLKRYKASVLKAAVEGRLVETEASIAQREGRSYETGEQLLQRILEERRAKWTGRGKYKPPVQAPTDGHDVLPEGWTTATADQLAHLITSGSRGWGDFYSDTGVLFIRAQDIKTDTLNLHNAARVDVPIDAEGTRSSVSEGDILVTITGANVTKSALVPEMDELAFVSQHVALMKLTQPETAPFVFNWIISPANGRKTLESWAYGAGKPGLSLEQVRTLPIALPPLAEQIRVVAEIDRHLSIIRKVEAEVDTDFKRAQSLRQSVLSKVFLGSAA